MDVIGIFTTSGLNFFNQNLPEGIVELLEIFALCCLVGGLVAFALCRTRHTYKARKETRFKAINSNRWADDRNKDAR
jgi:hypothetical protein